MQMPTHAGWFDDPADPTQLRYFDGVIWTSHTAPRATRSQVPAPGAAGSPGAGAGAGYAGQPQAGAGYPGGPGQPGQHGQHGQPGQFGQPGAVDPGQWSSPGYTGYPGSWGRPTTPDGQPLASYGQRVGAFLLDWLFQLVLAGLFGSYFLVKAFSRYLDSFTSAMQQAQAGQQPDYTQVANSIDRGQLMLYTLTAVVVFAVYQGVFLSRAGRTPGKMIVGLSVRLRERPGPLPASAVARRVGLPVVLFLFGLVPVPLLGLLGFLTRVLDLLWPSWDGSRQALHDKVAGTVVVVGEQPRR